MLDPFALMLQFIVQLLLMPLMLAMVVAVLRAFAFGPVMACIEPHRDGRVWIRACVFAFGVRVLRDTIFETRHEMLVLSPYPVTVTVEWRDTRLDWYKEKAVCREVDGGFSCTYEKLVDSGSTTSRYTVFTVEPGHCMLMFVEDDEGNLVVAEVCVASRLEEAGESGEAGGAGGGEDVIARMPEL